MLTSQMKPWYIKKFVGMNNKVEDNELSTEHSVLTQNARFENEPGALVKRDPVAFYNETEIVAGQAVHSAYRMYTTTGETKLLAICDNTLVVGNDITGVMTTLKSGLQVRKAVFRTYRNLCLISNGYDNILVYDGTDDNVVWELGACKALTGAGTGITATDVSYQITIDNDAYICGSISNEIASLTNENVELSNIPVGPAGTANRKIYRSDSGGPYRLLTTIADNTTTTYTDSTPTGSLGATIAAVTDDMPKGNLLEIHRERLFISGDPNEPNRIYYSNPFLPHYIQHITQSRFLEVFPDDNDEIQGIPIFQDTMICIKRNTLRKIRVTTATSGADPNSWFASDVISPIGSPAKWSIKETPYGIVFLSWDHWQLFDGSVAKEIMDEFDCDEILPADYRNVVSHWHDGIFYAAYTDINPGSQTKDKLMVYNFRRKALNLDLINVESFASFSGGDDTNELFYGASNLGHVYQAERAEKVVTWRKKSQLALGLAETGTEDISLTGEEDDPTLAIGRGHTIDEWDHTTNPHLFDPTTSSDIDNIIGTIDMYDTNGVYVLPSQQLKVGTFGRLTWNLNEFATGDTVYGYIRTGTTQALTEEDFAITAATQANPCVITATGHTFSNGDTVFITGVEGMTELNGKVYTVAGAAANTFQLSGVDSTGFTAYTTGGNASGGWDGPYTVAGGSNITATPNTWVQVMFHFLADSTAGSPEIYNTDGFNIKMTYTKGGNPGEDSVEFIHQMGFRNFDQTAVDKIFKKIVSNHLGEAGTFRIDWETENSSGSFTIDLDDNPQMWDSFFPSSAFGRKLDLTFYKNDLNDFKLKEVYGLYTPEPIII